MDPRTLPFLAAAAILIAVRIAMSWAERRHYPFFEPPSAELPRWNPGQLLLASFLTLRRPGAHPLGCGRGADLCLLQEP
jgi:hypothetical protein